MTFDPTHSGGGSDEPLDRTPREAVDETETAGPKAKPVPTHVAIEGYEIIRELHRGGQGIVYEAVQKSTKRKVAIKLLLEGRFASSSARRRFQREITLAAGLKHPNIIAIFDSGETPDGYQFCVMDYVRGRSIREYVRKSKLPLEDTLKLFSLVCEAAHFANQKGVVHRDLKPSNILVDTDGVPRVLDFGLAKQLAGGTQSLVSMTGQVMGTLQYMSPEQTRGNPDEIDARSDVYSLGVVLYELLTGTHPYPVKGDMLEVVKHITETEPELPSKVWTADYGVSRRKSGRFRIGQCPIDDELRTILLKSLSKGRERRYQSAGALRQDIVSYLASEPIEAKRDSSLYVLRKSLRRHRTSIAVMVGFVLVAAAALYVGSRTATRVAPLPDSTGPITSLAVLPLENLSGDPDQEYFADGMTAELITALGKIKALKVISRMSVMEYKGTEKSPSQIARELNVDALLEGNVTRSGNRVRIVANLIRASTSEQLWGGSYARDLRSILAMQGEIAQAVAGEIQIKLTPQEDVQLVNTRPVNPDAYEAYLLGDHYRRNWNTQGREKALRYFEQAIAIDPGYAPAYAGLAGTYNFLGFFGQLPRDEAFPKAKQLATLALELDDTLARAHRTLGLSAFYYDWDWVEAERSLRRATEVGPNDPGPHISHSWYLSAMGRFNEGVAEAQRARELDPLSLTANLAFGQALNFARRFDDAMLQFRACAELEPKDASAHAYLATLHERKGQFDLAAAEKEKHMRYSGRELEEIAAYSKAYAAGGWEGAVRWTIDNLEAKAGRKQGSVPSLSLATAYAKLGDDDKAFEWLERAYDQRKASLPYLAVDPSFDSLHDDPRFDNLLRRIGLRVKEKRPPTPKTANGKIMLAVLPFEDVSPDPQEWFSDGMTGELIATLGKIEALGVISRTSAMTYKNSKKSLPQIASELNANRIVVGSVLRAGGRVRINVELIDAATDTQLWSNTYAQDERDVIALQNEVARAVAGEIKIALSPQEESRLTDARRVDPEAYKLFLKGQSHTNKWGRENYKKAIALFEQAIDLDPTYAPAWAGLAEVYQMQGLSGHEPQQEVYPLAKTAATRALELDDTLGLAYATLGHIKFSVDQDWYGPEEDFLRAVELSPGVAHVHNLYSFYLILSGRSDEGIAEIKRALELDPFQSSYHKHLGWCYFYAGRHDESIAQNRAVSDKYPDYSVSRMLTAESLAANEMFVEALEECTNMGGCYGEAAWVYAVAGRPELARKEIDRLKSKEGRALEIAQIHAGLGEKNKAIEYLGKAIDEDHRFVLWLKTDPLLDPLRSDPRFDDLLRRIGLKVEEVPPSTSKTANGKIMLAVLPFEDMSREPQSWFADGMTDQVGVALGKIKAIGLISQHRTRSYKNTDKSLPQIARELNVGKVISGRVFRDKGRIRITVELNDAKNDIQLWASSYARDERDVIALQNEVALAVAHEINIALTPAEAARLATVQSVDPEAYNAYLRGLEHRNRGGDEEKLAIKMFDRAVKLDPRFALAYTQLSLAHSNLHFNQSDATEERAAQSKAAADKALSLQPDLPEAHAALAWYHYRCHRDYEAALKEFAIAEKGLPNAGEILNGTGNILRRQGNLVEALGYFRRNAELGPAGSFQHFQIAQTCMYLRRYAEADKHFDRAVSLAPDNAGSYLFKARNQGLRDGDTEQTRTALEEMPTNDFDGARWAWFLQDLFEGRYQPARERLARTPGESLSGQSWFYPKALLSGLTHRLVGDSQRSRKAFETARVLLVEEIKKRPDDHRMHSSLGIVYAGLGHKNDAIREGKRGVELFPVSKDALIGPQRVEDLALIYTMVGEYDAALDQIEYLLSIPSLSSIPLLRLDPRWDPLRDHPRYIALLRRHGFEPDPKPQTIDPPEATQTDDSTDSGG